MAGKTARPGTIGVGSALRRAREIGGISLEEASRDTRLRVEQLHALEDEDFEALGDDVYARAMLRTYAQYLGLKPGKVAAIYASHTDAPEPPSPPAKMGRLERGLAASRIRDNQKFLLIAAAVTLIVLVSVGLVSRSGAPAPAVIPSTTASAASPTEPTRHRRHDRRDRSGPGRRDRRRHAAGADHASTRRVGVVHGAGAARGDGVRRRRRARDGGRSGLRRAGVARRALDADLRARGIVVRAEIVAVGTELLLGQIANTNARWMSEQLAAVGVDVLHHQTVGDNVERVAEALSLAASRADVVLVTGGLGPTQDDLTREAIALVAGVPLVRRPELEAMLREKFRGFSGRSMPENNLQQADVPEGARAVVPERGTAPGLVVDLPGGVRLYAMAGVPLEMVEIMEGTVLPELAARTGAAIVSRVLRVTGMGESAVAEALADLFDASTNPTVAFLATGGEVKVRLTAKAATRGGSRTTHRAAGAMRSRRGSATSSSRRGTRRLEGTVLRLLASRASRSAPRSR